MITYMLLCVRYGAQCSDTCCCELGMVDNAHIDAALS